MIIIAVVSYTYLVIKEGLPKYNYRNIFLGYGTALIAVVFYFLGMDIDNDYLRWKHAMWHVILGSPCHIIWQAQLHGDDYWTFKEIIYGKKKRKKEVIEGKKTLKDKD
jgi:hypothetical protein